LIKEELPMNTKSSRWIAAVVVVSELYLAGIPRADLTTSMRAASVDEIDLEYLGMHVHEAADTGLWPAMSFGSWRLPQPGLALLELDRVTNMGRRMATRHDDATSTQD
jgi:hypothetical protein